LKAGKGLISTESGTLKEAQYSFGTRFENGVGTNPEELIAAAHAGCFSMAFAAELGKAGITPESIATTATITMEKTDAGFTVTQSHLDVTAKVPGQIRPKCSEIAKRRQSRLPDLAFAESRPSRWTRRSRGKDSTDVPGQQR
jgi:osmotically inducible protein OsmC